MGKLIVRMLAVCSILLLSRIEAGVPQQAEIFEIMGIIPMTAAVGSDVEVRLSQVISRRESKELMIAMKKRSPVFFDDIPAKVISIGENSIRVIVPSGLPSGSFPDVTIRYDRFVSPAFKNFQVTPFEITKILPSPAKPGSKVEIAISKRIDVDISDVRVAFNKELVKVIEITPEIITVEVPENLSPGSNPAVFVYLGDEQSELYTEFSIQQSMPARIWPYIVLGVIIMLTASTIYVVVRSRRKTKIIKEVYVDMAEEKITEQLKPPEIPEDLVKDCVTGNCVLYVGAGLSAQTGLPTWHMFVQDLLEWAIKEELIDNKYGESLRSALRGHDISSVADSIIHAIKKKKELKSLNNYLRIVFIDPQPPLPQACRYIREIDFNAILTTNFDRLLERTFDESTVRVYTPIDTDSLLDALPNREQFILKLYGTLTKPETVMIGQTQYESIVYGNKPFADFMQKLFYSRTILFIGTSLQGIESYLEGIEFREHSRSPHFALVAVTTKGWEAKAKTLMRNYSIKVLPYTPSENHSEFNAFLSDLVHRVREVSKSKLQSEKKRKSKYLQRVRLQNIGSFDEIEIELDRHWNILLGDNGVGKSTILKAIAVGIIGEPASPYADRLIKIPQKKAKIILYTSEGEEYKTIISKTNGGAEIESIPGPPFEAEQWLALGFPPMRMLTWKPIEGPKPEAGKHRITPDDLLPLVRDGADPRLDKLKQWIVNLDYRRSKEQGNGRYGRLFKEFFVIVNKLTKNVLMRFKEIDPSTNRVMMTTDDGIVPIESVSQGTTSIIGWVGVLLQRLYEIYGDNEDPREQYALVLVDEIDAHMHPAWQQSLVPDLQEIFPNAQFIATTHSPLIVGGMPVEQICRLKRDENTNVIKLEVKQDTTMGRADQVLTGSLFNLESTRDPQTMKLLEDYTDLATKESLTQAEQKELERIADDLKIRLPSSAERTEAREASKMIQRSLRKEWDAMPLKKRKKILKEVEAQLQEVITGARRPK